MKPWFWLLFLPGLLVWVAVAASSCGYMTRSYKAKGKDFWDEPFPPLYFIAWPVTLVLGPPIIAGIGIVFGMKWIGEKLWVRTHMAKLAEEELGKEQPSSWNASSISSMSSSNVFIDLSFGSTKLSTIAVPAGQSYIHTFPPGQHMTVDRVDVSFV